MRTISFPHGWIIGGEYHPIGGDTHIAWASDWLGYPDYRDTGGEHEEEIWSDIEADRWIRLSDDVIETDLTGSISFNGLNPTRREIETAQKIIEDQDGYAPHIWIDAPRFGGMQIDFDTFMSATSFAKLKKMARAGNPAKLLPTAQIERAKWADTFIGRIRLITYFWDLGGDDTAYVAGYEKPDKSYVLYTLEIDEPRRGEGLARAILKYLNRKHLTIEVHAVVPGYEDFWEKMKSEGLIGDWQHVMDTPPEETAIFENPAGRPNSKQGTPQIFHLMGHSFDIEVADEILEKHPREPDVCDITSLASWVGLIRVDPQIAKKADVEIPIYIAKAKSGSKRFMIVIDGWHRVAKALQKGLKELPCYAFTERETDRIQIR